MERLKLTDEEREALVFLTEHEGFPALMKVLHALVQLRQIAVLDYNLEGGTEKELAIRKSLAEGASKLVVSLQQALQDNKKPYTRMAASPAESRGNTR